MAGPYPWSLAGSLILCTQVPCLSLFLPLSHSPILACFLHFPFLSCLAATLLPRVRLLFPHRAPTTAAWPFLTLGCGEEKASHLPGILLAAPSRDGRKQISKSTKQWYWASEDYNQSHKTHTQTHTSLAQNVATPFCTITEHNCQCCSGPVFSRTVWMKELFGSHSPFKLWNLMTLCKKHSKEHFLLFRVLLQMHQH